MQHSDDFGCLLIEEFHSCNSSGVWFKMAQLMRILKKISNQVIHYSFLNGRIEELINQLLDFALAVKPINI